MIHHLLGMKHSGDTAGCNQLAALMVLIGYLPAAFYLRAQHHGQCNAVTLLVKIYRLNILIGK